MLPTSQMISAHAGRQNRAQRHPLLHLPPPLTWHSQVPSSASDKPPCSPKLRFASSYSPPGILSHSTSLLQHRYPLPGTCSSRTYASPAFDQVSAPRSAWHPRSRSSPTSAPFAAAGHCGTTCARRLSSPLAIPPRDENRRPNHTSAFETRAARREPFSTADGALKLRLERWLGISRKIRMKSGAAIGRG